MVPLPGFSAEPVANSIRQRFEFERYGTESGALFKSTRGNTHYNAHVHDVFVDTMGRVWVATVTGLSVYDGKRWNSRTFAMKKPSLPWQVLLGFLQITHCGPTIIVEGPPGTIWLGGDCGVWRFHDGRYVEINSAHIGSIFGMAVDHEGALWVVTKETVQKYDGKGWSTVLCPYIGKPKNYEAPGLYGIVIGANRNVWIGGAAYGEPTQPWDHEGPVWVVDQERKQRNGGPPMAPLFEFNGTGWRAFGAPHGLDVKSARPELTEQGLVRVKTSKGYFIPEGGMWKPVEDADVFPGKRWLLRARKIPQSAYSELFYVDGEHRVDVQPINAQTGEVLDLRSEQLVSLKIAEDRGRDCVWVGTSHGLYRIWQAKE